MPVFNYNVVKPDGETEHGSIDVADAETAEKLITDQYTVEKKGIKSPPREVKVELDQA